MTDTLDIEVNHLCEAAMPLCFLPPPPARPNEPSPSAPRRGDSKGGTVAAVIVSLVAGAALVAPIGWSPRSRGPAPDRVRLPAALVRPARAPVTDLALLAGPGSPLHRPAAYLASRAARAHAGLQL